MLVMIEIQNVQKIYGSHLAVDHLSLTIHRRTVFGFLGPNGAGKTTTMKMLVGISRPDSGSISVAGKSPGEPSAREVIGFMPENPYFYDRLTGAEFLSFCADLFTKKHGAGSEQKDVILKMVGIYDARNRTIATYSKGMKQRLGFAQALVNDPDYVFLDEPLDGLDPIGRREIKGIIQTLRREGKTIFFNSHVLGDVEEICDEIGVIHEGKLIYAGTIAEFCRGKPLEARFVEAIEQMKEGEITV